MKTQAQWKNEIARQFEISTEELRGFRILFEGHAEEDYSDSILLILRKDGALFEVEASHCSCYGFEGMWNPRKTTVGALLKRTPASLSDRDYVRFRDFVARLRVSA